MTVLRAAMVIGPGSAAFETIVALVDRLPGMVTPRGVSTADAAAGQQTDGAPLIEGLSTPTVARDDRIRDLVPFPLSSFEEAARAALRTRG